LQIRVSRYDGGEVRKKAGWCGIDPEMKAIQKPALIKWISFAGIYIFEMLVSSFVYTYQIYMIYGEG
jgi:hypothetical protein